MRHTWSEPTPITIDAPRCLNCGAFDYDGSRLNEDCPGPLKLCPNCKEEMEDGVFCRVCGHQEHGHSEEAA